MLPKQHYTATWAKYIFLTVIGFCSWINVYAQPDIYRVGIAANLPVVNAHTDTFSSRTGFGVWGNTELPINSNLRFTPTLAFNNFGYYQNYYNDSGIAQRRKITENYIDLVAELNYLPSPVANSIRINFGMGVSFLANRTTDQPDVLGQNVTQRTLDNKKAFTPNFIMNAGINAPLSKKIDFGLQYILSLPSKIYPLDVAGRLGTVQIRLSYKFDRNTATPKKVNGDETDPNTALTSNSLYNKDSLILVVRLDENLPRIRQLKNLGQTELANKERQKTLENNLEIVEAFKEKFTLLPVYYFYDTDSKTTLENGFEGVLLNEKLERDSTYHLPKKQYLIAEFARQFDEVSQTSGMFGLVIYDEGFKNIPEPFPSFTSNAYGLLSKKEVINKFQKRLYKYLMQ